MVLCIDACIIELNKCDVLTFAPKHAKYIVIIEKWLKKLICILNELKPNSDIKFRGT